MNITELQNINRDYEFLMDFIGLAEVHNEQGLTEYTADKLEDLEYILYDDLDFRHNGLNANEPKDFIQEFKSYVQSIDIDDEIDLYRQDTMYKQAFTITQSVRDFKNWKKDLKVLINAIKNKC